MAKDSASLASSEATTLYDSGEQRTSLTGKPITRTHDHHTSMMMADGGGGFGMGSAGANLLPPGYTDKSLVRIPIKLSDIYPPSEIQDDPAISTTKKKSFFSRKKAKKDEEIKVVMMSRGDYLAYWVKGDDGKFAASTVEPPGGRREWFEEQLRVNEEWVKNDPSLAGTKGGRTGVGFPLAALGSAAGGA